MDRNGEKPCKCNFERADVDNDESMSLSCQHGVLFFYPLHVPTDASVGKQVFRFADMGSVDDVALYP